MVIMLEQAAEPVQHILPEEPANVYDVNPAKGNPLKKPDIVAPGTDIVSCWSSGAIGEG